MDGTKCKTKDRKQRISMGDGGGLEDRYKECSCLDQNPVSFYDPNVKHGLGYENLYTLKKAIFQNPKLYDDSCFGDTKIHVHVRDTKDILEDATKSQMKMDNKLNDLIAIGKKQNIRTIDYNKLNALYEDFVPQKELFAEQKYFSSTFIPAKNHSNASTLASPSESKPSVASMPSPNPLKLYLEKMENEIMTLFALIQTNSKRESIFYTTTGEKRLTKFCQQECVNNNVQDEIEKIQMESIEIQEHEKERQKCKSSLKNVCETSWISKMEKLEYENVSLEFQVQSLIKEQENVKLEYQKLFDSIKKTRTQTQGEINELIEHVNQKTYAYAEVRAQNQDLLITIS
ncbi:hypothetical protein Tco_0441118 [Tanacetum coccineum]